MKRYLWSLFFTLVWMPASFAFSDVNQAHPYEIAINFWAEEGVLQGYSDGTFQPEKLVNRAEMIKMLVAAQKIDLSSESFERGCFSDVERGAWYEDYVCYAKYEGWVKGYGDGTFKPGQSVQNVEAIKMIAGAFELEERIETHMNFMELAMTGEDVLGLKWYAEKWNQKEWYFPYVLLAGEEEFMQDFSVFQVGDFSTRAELAWMMLQAMQAEEMCGSSCGTPL
jgi:hypothetical protein